MVRLPIKIGESAGAHEPPHYRISLIYGHPYMIDVVDCDARLPSSGDPNDLYLDELLRLSVLLGRVLKTIYTYVGPLRCAVLLSRSDPCFSPAGLMIATDEQLHKLLEDLEAWKEKLPENLRFNGPETGNTAGMFSSLWEFLDTGSGPFDLLGLLFMLYACVNMIFWRVFMRISYTCPPHLTFSLTVEKWTNLVKITGDVIDWLDKHENMYDVWLVTAYSATSCALVQVSSSSCRPSTLISDKLPHRHDLLCLYCRIQNQRFNFSISSIILGLGGPTPTPKQSLRNCVTA